LSNGSKSETLSGMHKKEDAMVVNKVIIHNLKKEQQQTATLFLSKKALVSTDKKSISLINELNSRFRENITYGIFTENSGDENTFQKELDKYLETKADDKFVELTKNTMNMLHQKIDTILLAKGGYIVFTDYDDDKKSFLFNIFNSG
jgi:nucleoid-associated protein